MCASRPIFPRRVVVGAATVGVLSCGGLKMYTGEMDNRCIQCADAEAFYLAEHRTGPNCPESAYQAEVIRVPKSDVAHILFPGQSMVAIGAVMMLGGVVSSTLSVLFTARWFDERHTNEPNVPFPFYPLHVFLSGFFGFTATATGTVLLTVGAAYWGRTREAVQPKRSCPQPHYRPAPTVQALSTSSREEGKE